MRKTLFIVMSLLFFLMVPNIGNASVFFFSPQSTEHQESDTFIKSLYIDTEDQKINAIKSKINFDRDALEVVDVITGNSIIKLWVKAPTISNKEGNIEFVGGIPNGYEGKGVILKIIFKAKKIESCNLTLSDTKALLSNGKATEDKISFLDNSCDIIEKADDFIKITSGSHPNQDEWQNNDTISLHWDLTDEAEYSYILSKDPLMEPDEIPNKPEGELVWMGSMSYEGLEDGIYYFHLKQKLPDENWSPKTTVRTMLDTTSPEEFTIQIVDIEEKKYLVFSTTDATSGIDHYELLEISLDWNKDIRPGQKTEWKTVQSPYLLKGQSLNSIIRIKAIDKAGNERLSEIVLFSKPKPSPNQIVFLAIAGIAIIALIIALIVWKLFLKRNRNKK